VGVAITPDGKSAYVADEVAARVLAVGTRTRKTTEVPVGEGPFDVAVGPDGKSVYAAVLGPGKVSVIDTGSNRVSSTVSVGPPGTDPFNLEVTSQALYVTEQAAGTLTVIDPKSNRVLATVTGESCTSTGTAGVTRGEVCTGPGRLDTRFALSCRPSSRFNCVRTQEGRR
jgi:YVTN family beta-propeller protein